MANYDFSNVQIVHGKRTIVSIYPKTMSAWREFGPTVIGGRTKYVIEAPKNKGEYTKLDVFDAFQRVVDPMQSQPDRPAWMPFPENALAICKCLLKQWVDDVNGTSADLRPGIMIIEGEDPTEEELSFLRANQQRYFEVMVQRAQGHAERNEDNMITDIHRLAARATGYRPSGGERNWVADIGTNQRKECTSCFTMIDARSRVCANCKSPQDVPVVESAPEAPRKGGRIPPPIAPPLAAATA